MPKAILNYTTEVEATKSIAEIQAILQAHGAKSILINFSDDGQVAERHFLLTEGK